MKQKGLLSLIANMLFASKNCLLEKVAFTNSSLFMICELNWIVFMAIEKAFSCYSRKRFFRKPEVHGIKFDSIEFLVFTHAMK